MGILSKLFLKSLKVKNFSRKNKYYGNSVTNEAVIRSELILDEGDPFTKLNLEKSISEIKERNIFKNVKYTVADGSERV